MTFFCIISRTLRNNTKSFVFLQVIAVVMDVFTDVDIFKDLIETGFKKKVAIYIIIDFASIQHFLQMCERAKMHRGHLNVSRRHMH